MQEITSVEGENRQKIAPMGWIVPFSVGDSAKAGGGFRQGTPTEPKQVEDEPSDETGVSSTL